MSLLWAQSGGDVRAHDAIAIIAPAAFSRPRTATSTRANQSGSRGSIGQNAMPTSRLAGVRLRTAIVWTGVTAALTLTHYSAIAIGAFRAWPISSAESALHARNLAGGARVRASDCLDGLSSAVRSYGDRDRDISSDPSFAECCGSYTEYNVRHDGYRPAAGGPVDGPRLHVQTLRGELV